MLAITPPSERPDRPFSRQTLGLLAITTFGVVFFGAVWMTKGVVVPAKFSQGNVAIEPSGLPRVGRSQPPRRSRHPWI